MNAIALRSFGFGDQLVRVIEQDGGAWFVGKDVCAALEIANSRTAIARLEDDEKGVHTMDTLGGAQQVTIVSESGVYALIFTSRKAVAVQFRKWVTGEVLPTLRRTGKYEMPQNDDEDCVGNTDPIGVALPFLGTRDEREQMRVAVLLVRECKDLYGVPAGRQMWQKLGFPVPEVDLSPDRADPAAPKEGDVVAWGHAVGLKPSRRDATHKRDLYTAYVQWCSAQAVTPIHPDRFDRMMLAMFDREEHPEMIRVIMTRWRKAA